MIRRLNWTPWQTYFVYCKKTFFLQFSIFEALPDYLEHRYEVSYDVFETQNSKPTFLKPGSGSQSLHITLTFWFDCLEDLRKIRFFLIVNLCQGTYIYYYFFQIRSRLYLDFSFCLWPEKNKLLTYFKFNYLAMYSNADTEWSEATGHFFRDTPWISIGYFTTYVTHRVWLEKKDTWVFICQNEQPKTNVTT